MNPISVWIAFVLAHLWLGLLNLYAPGLPLGDVTIVYKFWMDQALIANYWVGIDSAWVYPILALLPMLAATIFGPEQFASTWLSMVMILNAVAFGFVTDWGRARDRVVVAWWWVAFLVLLGPIALARIDSVTVALAIVGALVIARRPGAAGIVLAIATWIKVWPAAIVVAAVIAFRDRLRVVAAVLGVSAVVLVASLLIGSGGNVLSFITQQAGRGLQVEAPVSTLWLWRIVAGEPNTFIYYDRDILTYQVNGNGVDVSVMLMTPLLAIVIGIVVWLGIHAARRGAEPGDLFAPLVLALVSALIAFNKVGSPQFVSWLAVPIIVGVVASAAGLGPSFRVPATLALVIAALTQFVYPYLYSWLLVANPVMVSVLTIRNALYFVLLAWAIVTVARAKGTPSILGAAA